MQLDVPRYGKLEVGFRYRNLPDGPRETWCEFREPSIKTETFGGLKTTEQGRLFSLGYARMIPADNFDRAKGRKLALGRALRMLGLSRPERQRVWEQIWSAVKELPDGRYVRALKGGPYDMYAPEK